jgi:hypothetical protein
MIRSFQYFFNIVIAEGGGIAEIVFEYFELISIVAVEAGHGAYPEKTSFIFEEAIDPVVGKSLVDIQSRKTVKAILGKAFGGPEAGQ